VQPDFVWRHARLVDRRRFAYFFDRGAAEAVVAAVAAYQNPDGGFGNALEPDIRGPGSQPVPTQHAFEFLEEVGALDHPMVGRACDFLVSISDGGGVPFVLPHVDDHPHAPWWVPEHAPSLNPTAAIAGVLHKAGVTHHPWLDAATEYCWREIPSSTAGGDDAVAIARFLDHAPDRRRAEGLFGAFGPKVAKEHATLDPAAEGYVKMPLDFAPTPSSLARAVFDDSTIDAHLEALAARQQPDGGWPITWDPPSEAARWEWRGEMTVRRLLVLRAYGRLG